MPPTPKPQYPRRRGDQVRVRPSRLGVYAVIAAAVVVAAIVAAILVRSGGDETSTEPSALVQGVPQDGMVLGDPDAPVTLVEYADFQCPFCRQFALEVFPELVERYVRTGDVKVELRGLAFIGDDSRKALEHVLAASEQDAAWDYADLLFRNQGGENTGWVTDELLAGIATASGLDADEVAERAASGETSAEIAREAERAGGLGIASTPSFLLGPSGGELTRLEVAALEPGEFIVPIDAVLADARG